MKKIDNRVLDIERADFNVKFEYNSALKMNVMRRVLNTPDEKFYLITNNCISLKIKDNIEIILRESNDDAEIIIYQDGSFINGFLYKEQWMSIGQQVLAEKEEQVSDCEMLRNKIKSVREIMLIATPETEKKMSIDTKRFYGVFDAISNM